MIAERLQFTATQNPEAVALVDGETSLRYGDLIERTEAFARYLSDELGIRRGDVVGFFLPNCWQFVSAFFALAKLGAVCMPFNTHWRAAELRWYLARFPISADLTNQELRGPWDELNDVVAPERRIVVDGPEFTARFCARQQVPIEHRENRPFDDEVALQLTTSGSTGRPRVTPRSQAAMLAGAANVGKAVGIRAGQRCLAVVPFYHSHGFSNSMFVPLLLGATVVLQKKFVPVSFARLVLEHKIDMLVVSPFILRMVADRNIDADTFASVEVCLSSGAPTPRELAELWHDRYGVRVRQLYGSSETGTISIEPADSPIRGGAVGVTVPSVEVKVIDEQGFNRSFGEVGDVVVRSPAMSMGYLGEPELNSQAFIDGYFRTGDLGRLDSDGTLTIVGRKKKTINFGGIKVDPHEIEGVIQKMPGVRQCRVQGVLDPRKSEIIRAVIEVGSERGYTRRDVVAHCREFLAEYKIPRIIELVDEIPMDVTGKVALAWEPS